MASCVSKKKFNTQAEQYRKLKADFDTTKSNLQRMLEDKDAQQKQ